MTYSHANTVTLDPMLDGRQTAGRKGIPYDWQRVLLEGLDHAELRISDEDMTALLSASTAA